MVQHTCDEVLDVRFKFPSTTCFMTRRVKCSLFKCFFWSFIHLSIERKVMLQEDAKSRKSFSNWKVWKLVLLQSWRIPFFKIRAFWRWKGQEDVQFCIYFEMNRSRRGMFLTNWWQIAFPLFAYLELVLNNHFVHCWWFSLLHRLDHLNQWHFKEEEGERIRFLN